MIRNYKFLQDAVQLKLHEMIIAFFNRIEFETGPFKEEFFSYSLAWLTTRHPTIIKQRCKDIYDHMRGLSQKDRTELCNAIRESNELEAICKGLCTPKKIEGNATGFEGNLRQFFIDLYDQVLNGKGFNEQYQTSLTEHFIAFSKLNDEVTLCPVCGICELKKHTDKIRDQYDHYLPKALYPFSSVNFKNLVPVCNDCNSLQVKGDTDIVAAATNKKLFFLFDESHRGVTVSFQMTRDNANPSLIEWQINFHNPDNQNDEISSWKTIYKIESRYHGFVNGRIEKWYRHYWEYMNRSSVSHYAADVKRDFYELFLEKDQEKDLGYIRKPALDGFLNSSILAQAAIEAKHYSLNQTATN